LPGPPDCSLDCRRTGHSSPSGRAGGCPESLDRKARHLTVVGKRNKLRVIGLKPFGGAVIFQSVPPGIAKAPLFRHGKGERRANLSSRFASLNSGARRRQIRTSSASASTI
jgi:hypothetical protein